MFKIRDEVTSYIRACEHPISAVQCHSKQASTLHIERGLAKIPSIHTPTTKVSDAATHRAFFSSPPRILIADLDFRLLESLPPCLQEALPHCEIDLCPKHEKALKKLLAVPYEVIISSMHLAEIKDFYLLEQTKLVQPLTPFVVTATATDRASAQEALQRGAFEFILKPLNTQEVSTCVCLVRQHEELRRLLAIEQRAWETYHYALTIAQTNQVHPMYESFKQLTTTYRTSIQRVDESVSLINRMMRDVRTQAHAQASERLKLLGAKKNEQLTHSMEPASRVPDEHPGQA